MQPARRRDVVDMAMQGEGVREAAQLSRSKVLARLRLSDNIFKNLTRGAAYGVLLLLTGVIVSPSARPSPSMKPPITPTRVNGSTTKRKTSQVVQPTP